MKKIVLNEEGCIGCGACIGIDSEHFEFNDDGFSSVKSQENLESPALSDAIDACPVAVISLEDTSDTEDVLSTDSKDSETCSCGDCECGDCLCEKEDSCCKEEKAA